VIRVALAATLVSACGSAEPASPLPRDLMRDLASARIQPAATSEVARLGDVVTDGVATPALLVTSPARLTWSVRFAERAALDGMVAMTPPASAPPVAGLGVTVRIGISDERAYEELFRIPLAAPSGATLAWTPVRVDLSGYSGWTWSLFYRPSRRTWQLIVAADPLPGGSIAWRSLRLVPHTQD
jgi:hypothetical protein